MKCIRCHRERSIPGFCEECYLILYGLRDIEPIIMKMDDLVCNAQHLTLVERDCGYTDIIRQSIIREGLKNPIIVDNKNRILIGHHRYFIGRELGWETIPCYVVSDEAGYNKFIEGGLNNLFVIKIGGKIIASVTRIEDVVPMLHEWVRTTPFWKTSHLVLEAFTGIGASNDAENWEKRNIERIAKCNGRRNLAEEKR